MLTVTEDQDEIYCILLSQIVCFFFQFNKSLNKMILFLLTGDAKFCSATYRLFKLPKSEKSAPLQVIYSGDITGSEDQLDFDLRNHFKVSTLHIGFFFFNPFSKF